MALSDAWGHDGVSYNGKEMRELVESLTGSLSGVTGPSAALKVSQQTVAAATVKVAEGGAIIPATGAGLGGSYQVYNDADLTSPTIAPTSANGRKDRLILRVTAGVPALEVVQGVASGSPVEPSITGDNYLELALITLPASTTNITDAMITDRRVRLDTPEDRAGGPLATPVTRTTDAGPFSAEADISGLTISLPASFSGGRHVRLAFAFRAINGTVVADAFAVRIKEGATTLQEMQVSMVAAPSSGVVGNGGTIEVWLTPTAGAHTYKVSALRLDGTGVATLKASSTFPATLTATDYGGV